MNLLATRRGRLAAFFLLYVTEGLPLGFAAGAVAVYMRREGVAVDDIGWFLGALYAPWGFKWLFGPVVDLVGSRRFGHRRSWILLTQLVMVLGLLASAFVDYSEQLLLFTVVMVVVNGVCAVQDVAIDALAVSALKEEERGLGNGLMFAGAYLGQALGGSGMLYLASATGSLTPAFGAVALMVGTVWAVAAFGMREDPANAPPRLEGAAAVGRAVGDYALTAGRALFASVPALAAAAFAILPASAMALGLALSSTLAVEVGYTDGDIATLGILGAVAAATGSVFGGVISDKTGHRRTLAVYVLLTLLPTAALGWTMHQVGWIVPVTPGPDAPVPPAVLATVFWYASIAYGFFSGLTYGTRMAIFMRVCDPKVAATQFTAYMAASNLAISYTAAWQGNAVAWWGYPTTLALDCLAGIACIALLPLIRPQAAVAPDAAPIPLPANG